MKAVSCIACVYWRSQTNESGWCTIVGTVDGRCEDGSRRLWPVTFALDGCVFGERKEKDKDDS